MVLSSCSDSSITEIPLTAEITSPQRPISTPSPAHTLTPTIIPTTTPTPFSGGGKILMVLEKSNYPEQASLQGDANLFIADPEGSEIKPISDFRKNQFIYLAGISPNRKYVAIGALGVKSDLFILDVSSENIIQIANDKLNLFNSQQLGNPKLILWLPNNKLAFVAEDGIGTSIFIVEPTGKNLTRLTKPEKIIETAVSLLAGSADASGIYWVTGKPCNDIGICDGHYYWTKLDDSAQQQVWKQIKAASDHITISPTGDYLAYRSYFSSGNPLTGCYIAPMNGIDIGNIVQLLINGNSTNCEYMLQNPWSPDGRFLVVSYWDFDQEVLSLWSSIDHSFIQFPETETKRCYFGDWLADYQVFLYDCYLGDPIPLSGAEDMSGVAGPQLIDLSMSNITIYPPLGGFNHYHSFSPDKTKVLFASGRGSSHSKNSFLLLDLQTMQISPIFGSLVPSDFLWLEDQ
jgi:Tol biopolymer transport system component